MRPTKRTVQTQTPYRQAAMLCAAANSTSKHAQKPGRTLARLTDAEVKKRRPQFRRRVARWQLAQRVVTAEQSRMAKAGA